MGRRPDDHTHRLDRTAQAGTGAGCRAGRPLAVLARQLATVPATPVAFVDVRAFVDGTRFAEHQTVIVNRGKIIAVGPVASIKVPANAKILAGAGQTLVPGLWDSHMHVSDDYSGPFELSLGVTSIRDPGNAVALTKARRERRAGGGAVPPSTARR